MQRLALRSTLITLILMKIMRMAMVMPRPRRLLLPTQPVAILLLQAATSVALCLISLFLR